VKGRKSGRARKEGRQGGVVSRARLSSLPMETKGRERELSTVLQA